MEVTRFSPDEVVNVLALDGGGVRGIVSMRILEELMNRVGRSVEETFDVIAGSSAGAISTAGLTAPEGLTPGGVKDFYYNHAEQIFNRDFKRAACNPCVLFRAQYGSEGLEDLLDSTIGTPTMGDLKGSDVVMTYFDAKHQCFATYSKLETPCVPLWDAVQASSAAPTYFPAAGTKIDGGVGANNPVLFAVAHAVKQGASLDKVRAVSIGTGRIQDPIYPGDWGRLRWATEILQTTFSAQAYATHTLAQTLLNDEYARFQPKIKQENSGIVDISRKNLDALLEQTEAFIESEEGDTLLNECARHLAAD